MGKIPKFSCCYLKTANDSKIEIKGYKNMTQGELISVLESHMTGKYVKK